MRRSKPPWPVVAHPPCDRWGRYWGGGPSAKVRRKLGEDGGCFESALRSIKKWGGLIEHPEASHAWRVFGLTRPNPIGWTRADETPGAWTCQVEQGHYGHPARKKTWLYYIGGSKPDDLIWGPSIGIRLDEGFHSAEERRAARLLGHSALTSIRVRPSFGLHRTQPNSGIPITSHPSSRITSLSTRPSMRGLQEATRLS